MEAIEGQQVAYDDEDDPSAAGHADPYGYNPTTPGDQDEFLDQFGYTDPGSFSERLSRRAEFERDVTFRWIPVRWSRITRCKPLEFVEQRHRHGHRQVRHGREVH